MDDFVQHIQAQNTTRHRRLEFGMRRSCARRRFNTFIAKRKCLDHFWKSVAEEGVKVVMYGSATIESTGKGETAVAVKDVAEAAKRYVTVIATPEFRTTKLCASCWKEAAKCGPNARSVRCSSTECFDWGNRRSTERDLNASKCIRQVGVHVEEHGVPPDPFKQGA